MRPDISTMTAQDLADEIALNDQDAKYLAERTKALKARILELFPHEGDHQAGERTVRIGVTRRFDDEGFTKTFPAETNGHLYKIVPNTDAIPKTLKDQFMANSSMRISIR